MSGPAMTARIVEAAARAYLRETSAQMGEPDPLGPCFPDDDEAAEVLANHCAAARAALAAVLREAGMDRDELVAAARETAAEAEREMLLDIGDHALTGKTAALLRALAEIAAAVEAARDE
jgi:hypothetical protein